MPPPPPPSKPPPLPPGASSNPFGDASPEANSPVSSNPFGDNNDSEGTAYSSAPPRPPRPSTSNRPSSPIKPAKPPKNPLEVLPPDSSYLTEKTMRSSDIFSSTGQTEALSTMKTAQGDSSNLIYHKVTFSVFWWVLTIFIHSLQFSILLTVGYGSLGPGAFAICLLLAIGVAVLLLASRMYVTKSRLSSFRNAQRNDGVVTPDDEKDIVQDRAVYCVASAAVMEGILFAVYTTVTAGSTLKNNGFYEDGTMLQTLRFASVTLLAFHRILRPANRLDPVRTFLELEVVAVCWDALDGSTLYQLFSEDLDIGRTFYNAIRVLMAFWYVSVGIRIAVMTLAHCTPDTAAYQRVLTAPLALDSQPTVDRTFQGLRLRASVIMVMSLADLYAIAIRLTLWVRGQLEEQPIQQEMALKNILFLASMSGAYSYYMNTTARDWNSREIFMCIM
jgi:hypothetical protein